jgi:hypothetical protein
MRVTAGIWWNTRYATTVRVVPYPLMAIQVDQCLQLDERGEL